MVAAAAGRDLPADRLRAQRTCLTPHHRARHRDDRPILAAIDREGNGRLASRSALRSACDAFRTPIISVATSVVDVNLVNDGRHCRYEIFHRLLRRHASRVASRSRSVAHP